MLQLVFTACLLSQSGQCQNIEVPLDDKATINSCLKTAHDKALDWQAGHATYMVVGWHCKVEDKPGAKPSDPSKDPSQDPSAAPK